MTGASVYALVPAGGRGERFGGVRPKQFLAVAGRPLLQWTVERLLGLDLAGVTVAVPGEQLVAVEGWFPQEPRLRWVAGGDTRQDSVGRCLAATPGEPADLLLVHDGARPATARTDVEAVLAAAAESGAAVLGRMVSDTVKRVRRGEIVETLDRRYLFRAETPQVVRRDLLAAGLYLAGQEGRQETDEAALLERVAGCRIRAVEARFPNPKLTLPADLPLLEALLREARVEP